MSTGNDANESYNPWNIYGAESGDSIPIQEIEMTPADEEVAPVAAIEQSDFSEQIPIPDDFDITSTGAQVDASAFNQDQDMTLDVSPVEVETAPEDDQLDVEEATDDDDVGNAYAEMLRRLNSKPVGEEESASAAGEESAFATDFSFEEEPDDYATPEVEAESYEEQTPEGAYANEFDAGQSQDQFSQESATAGQDDGAVPADEFVVGQDDGAAFDSVEGVGDSNQTSEPFEELEVEEESVPVDAFVEPSAQEDTLQNNPLDIQIPPKINYAQRNYELQQRLKAADEREKIREFEEDELGFSSGSDSKKNAFSGDSSDVTKYSMIALILGVISIITGFVGVGVIFGVIGLILGLKAKKIDGNNNAGITVSIVGLVISVLVLLLAVTGINNIPGHVLGVFGGSKKSTTSVTTAAAKTTAPATQAAAATTAPAGNTGAQATTQAAAPASRTKGEDAILASRSYLGVRAYSYEGLKAVLVGDGYSEADAKFGLDNTQTDWNAQAVRKAQEYLTFQPFSQSSLVEQLTFDKFTREQAEYGAANCGANWIDLATQKAKTQVEGSSNISHAELVDRLQKDGFTQAQAEAGAKAVGK